MMSQIVLIHPPDSFDSEARTADFQDLMSQALNAGVPTFMIAVMTPENMIPMVQAMNDWLAMREDVREAEGDRATADRGRRDAEVKLGATANRLAVWESFGRSIEKSGREALDELAARYRSKPIPEKTDELLELAENGKPPMSTGESWDEIEKIAVNFRRPEGF